MHRIAITYLIEHWLKETDRKPLVIRGARQVGKTWLIRKLAELSQKKLLEINFERNRSYLSLFDSNDPKKILLNLSVIFNHEIDVNQSILFLDEIQAVPELLAKLRWFKEDLPALPVIAAGSLLDFVLDQHTFNMPVGRINYMHLEPFSFEEFLLANDHTQLYQYLMQYQWETVIPTALHNELLQRFKEYILIGGMPAALTSWVNDHSLVKINQIHHDLLATYRDDFAKYRGKIQIEKLDEIMMAIPKLLGQKFVYRHINPDVNSRTIKQTVNLLNKARVCHCVISTAANGIPLAAETKEKFFKEIFLDTGLNSAALGLTLNHIQDSNQIILVNKGGVAEQVVGQLLRTLFPPYIEPALYYWFRDEKNSNAEIDYIIQHANQVIPIEVKAGATGTLKSLHLFMGLKKLSIALRINADPPNKTAVDTATNLKERSQYTLLSLPFYLTGQIHRLIDARLSSSR